MQIRFSPEAARSAKSSRSASGNFVSASSSGPLSRLVPATLLEYAAENSAFLGPLDLTYGFSGSFGLVSDAGNIVARFLSSSPQGLF